MSEGIGASAMETTWAPQAAVFCEGYPCSDEERIYAGDLIYTCGKPRNEDPDDMLRLYKWNSPLMEEITKKPSATKTLLGITDETYSPGDAPSESLQPNKLIRVQVSGLAMFPLAPSVPLESFPYGRFVLVSEKVPAAQNATSTRKRRRTMDTQQLDLKCWRGPKLPLEGTPIRNLEPFIRMLNDSRKKQFGVPAQGFSREDGNNFEKCVMETFGSRSKLLELARAWTLQIVRSWKNDGVAEEVLQESLPRLVNWLTDVSRNSLHDVPSDYVCLGRVRGHVEDKHALVIELTRSTWSKNPVRGIF